MVLRVQCEVLHKREFDYIKLHNENQILENVIVTVDSLTSVRNYLTLETKTVAILHTALRDKYL